MSIEKSIHYEKVKFNYSDFDVYDRVLPSTLFRICQDAAGRHGEELGIGYLDLLNQGALWVISKAVVKILGKIEYGKEYALRTWAHRKRIIYFPREYELLDEKGNKLMVALSSWHIFSLNERSIINPKGINLADFEKYYHEESSFESSVIFVPKELETFAGEKRLVHEVTYSQLDHNHHMNNTKYIDLALDSIPDVLDAKRSLKEVTALFCSECNIGDVIETLYEKVDDEYYIRGVRNEKNVFSVSFKFEEER